MSPEAAAVLSALAAVFAILVSIAIGAVSIVLVVRSNRTANDALTASRRAVELSEKSNTIAVDANDISVRSNSLAQEANDISRAGGDRAVERNDVDWAGHWRRPGVYVLTNRGQDAAHAVRATVTIDDETATVESPEVAHDDEMIFNFPRAADTYVLEERERAEKARPSTVNGINMASFYISPLFGNDHRTEERITWKTPLGVPKLHDKFWNMSSIAPDTAE